MCLVHMKSTFCALHLFLALAPKENYIYKAEAPPPKKKQFSAFATSSVAWGAGEVNVPTHLRPTHAQVLESCFVSAHI